MMMVSSDQRLRGGEVARWSVALARWLDFSPLSAAVVFALIALPTCVTMIFVVPPGQVADEWAHVLRADSLLKSQFAGHRELTPDLNGGTMLSSGVVADPSLFFAVSGMEAAGEYDARRIAQAKLVSWSGRAQFFPIYTIATYPPFFYLPSALGIAAAKASGLRPYAAIQAARLMNVLTFVGCGFVALLLARRGRAFLMCVLLLPMTLSLAASVNQDGILIGASVLAASLLSSADLVRRVETSGRTNRHFAARLGVAAVILLAVVSVKPPYAALALMLLLPANVAMAIRIVVVAVVAFCVLGWLVHSVKRIATPIPRPAYAAGPNWQGDPAVRFKSTDPAAQARVLMAKPSLIATLPVEVLVDYKYGSLWHQAIGVLGWLTIQLPERIYNVWTAVFLIIALLSLSPPIGAGCLGRAVLVLGAIGVTLWAIFLSQYLAWTNVGGEAIDGPQGRYILPALPLLVFMMRTEAGRGSALQSVICWIPAAIALISSVAAVRELSMLYS